MLKNYFQNTRKPEGFGGKTMVMMMNKGHARLAEWGFKHVDPSDTDAVLDIGCGGGANISVLLSMCPNGCVTGIDYSPVSVAASKKRNRDEVDSGRCNIVLGSVVDLPFKEQSFDLVTAFETVYFWPEIESSFHQVFKVLKPDGIFMICNELSDAADERWTKIIPGMSVYGKHELVALLREQGFTNIKTDTVDKKRWLCVTAQKPGSDRS